MSLKRKLYSYGLIIIGIFLLHFFTNLILTEFQNKEFNKKGIAHNVVKNMNDLLILSAERNTYHYNRIDTQWLEKLKFIKKFIIKFPELNIILQNDIESLQINFLLSQDNIKNKKLIKSEEIDKLKRNNLKEIWLMSKMQIESRAIVSKAEIIFKNKTIEVILIGTIKKRIALFVSMLVLMIVFYSSYKIINSTIVPLSILLQNINEIEKGNISVSFSSKEKKKLFKKTKEIFILSEAFERMTISLKATFKMLKSESEKNISANKELKKQSYLLMNAEKIGLTGSWELNIVNNKLKWSDQTYKIFNVRKDTPLTYEMFINFIHPDDKESLIKEWSAALKGKPYNVEHRILINGKVKWIIEKAKLVFDENKKPISATSFVQDISERKEGEKELKEYHEKLEMLVQERTKEIETINEELKSSNEGLIISNENLNNANKELEEFNDLFIGREFRIKELRDKVKELENKIL